jgi:plastocyanin
VKTIAKGLLPLALLFGSGVVNAALVAVTGGLLVNDTDHNITWTANANLFQTQAAQSGDAAAFVATIISDWGEPFVSPNFNNGVSYSLTAADFDPSSGGMSWFGAVAWINYLNVTNYQGYSDWRFPNIGGAGSEPGICGGGCYPSNSGQPISSSEWWELFFTELGGVERTSISTTHNGSYSLFSSIQGGYWSNGLGNLDSVNTFTDLALDFANDSAQSRGTTNSIQSVWAVRSGLSVASPPPMAHLVLVPSRLISFGNQVVGTASAPQLVKVTSTGTGPATIAISTTGDFAATSDCPASLATGANCTISLTFNPTAVDARTGSLTVTAGVVYSVALSGTGTIAVSLTSSASTVTAGVPITLTWTSASDATCTASGGGSGDGWSGNLPTSGGTTSVTETAAGTYTYILVCHDGLQGADAQAVVTDTIPSVTISANPTNLMFGQPTTLTWTSTSAASCTASSNGTGDGWSGTKATSGTASIAETTVGMITLTLTCTSGPQSAQASTQIFNNAKPSSGGGGELDILSLLALGGVFALGMARRRSGTTG